MTELTKSWNEFFKAESVSKIDSINLVQFINHSWFILDPRINIYFKNSNFLNLYNVREAITDFDRVIHLSKKFESETYDLSTALDIITREFIVFFTDLYKLYAVVTHKLRKINNLELKEFSKKLKNRASYIDYVLMIQLRNAYCHRGMLPLDFMVKNYFEGDLLKLEDITITIHRNGLKQILMDSQGKIINKEEPKILNENLLKNHIVKTINISKVISKIIDDLIVMREELETIALKLFKNEYLYFLNELQKVSEISPEKSNCLNFIARDLELPFIFHNGDFMKFNLC